MASTPRRCVSQRKLGQGKQLPRTGAATRGDEFCVPTFSSQPYPAAPLHVLPAQAYKPRIRNTGSQHVGPHLSSCVLCTLESAAQLHPGGLVGCTHLPLGLHWVWIKSAGLLDCLVDSSCATADMDRRTQPGTPINLPLRGSSQYQPDGGQRSPRPRGRWSHRCKVKDRDQGRDQALPSDCQSNEACRPRRHRGQPPLLCSSTCRLHRWRRMMLPR